MEIGKREKSTETWKEYKKSKQHAKRVIGDVALVVIVWRPALSASSSSSASVTALR